MNDLAFNKIWLPHDGKIITIDGHKRRLEVSTVKCIYPYEYTGITVYATCINKQSKYYRDVRHDLGDDWSTDVLQLDYELQVEILRELGEFTNHKEERCDTTEK